MKTILGLSTAGIVLALLLVSPAALAGDDAPAAERAALDRVLAALEARPPRTVAAYRVAFRELGLVGDSALPHLKALLRRYVNGPGLDDAHAHAFLGDRHFDHPLPEEITFRGHSFLRTVEAANAQEWFRRDRETAWILARAALGATRLHHRRLVEDRRYRAGDQMFANVALDPRHAGRELHFTWADPYAVVQVGPLTPARDVEAKLAVLRTTYRTFLAEYGEHFGLTDLMEPWGGRPDERAHVRSFPDGAPLTVVLYDHPRTFQEIVLGGPRDYPPFPPRRTRELESWLSPAGVLHAAGSEPLGEAAVEQVLWWFARQQNRWGRPPVGRDAVVDGFAEWFAARMRGPEADARRLAELQATAEAFARLDRAYPVFPLEKLIALSTNNEIATYAASAWQVPGIVGIGLFRDQAWALARMLQDDRYRASFLKYLAAWMHRETGYGQNLQVFERAFGRRDTESWQALEDAWRRTLPGSLPVASDDLAAPARSRLLVEMMRYDDGVEHGTQVIVWDHGRQRMLLPAIRLPHASGAQPSERLLPVFDALNALPRDADGARPAVFLRHRPQKDRKAPRADERFVLLALLVAGYDDILLDVAISPEVRAFLEAWQATAGNRAER